MLRDINRIEDGLLDSTGPFVGALASQIRSGADVPGFMENDLDDEFPTRRYRLYIRSVPPSTTVYADGFGKGSIYSTAPNGLYSGEQTVEKYDEEVGLVIVADGTYALQVGALPATVTGVSVQPANAIIFAGMTQKFTHEVLGTNEPSQEVTYTVDLGQVAPDGTVTAPAATNVDQTGIVTATSVADPRWSGSASFIVPALPFVEPPEEEPPVDTSGAPSIFATTIMSDDGIYLSTVLL